MSSTETREITLPDGSKHTVSVKEPSCYKCWRQPTCVIFRNANAFISNAFPPTPEGKSVAPYRPDEIAKICAYYAAVTKEDTLTR